MFTYYTKWIPKFSNIMQPLIKNKTFPWNATNIKAFKTLWKQLENATLQNIDENVPFIVECDASDVATAATLNQRVRSEAFMSHTLKRSELHYTSIKKEATAIIKAAWWHSCSITTRGQKLKTIKF